MRPGARRAIGKGAHAAGTKNAPSFFEPLFAAVCYAAASSPPNSPFFFLKHIPKAEPRACSKLWRKAKLQ